MTNTGPISKPKDWFHNSVAFVVGIESYDHFKDLPNAVNDAKDIANLLENTLPNYAVKKLLLNATYNEIIELLEKDIPLSITDENTQLIIYFAGHGFATAKTNLSGPTGYMLPSDASKKNFEKFIRMQDVYDKLCNLPIRPKHLLLILDCCFAGSFKWNTLTYRGPGVENDTIYRQRYERFISTCAWQVFTSCSYNQEAIDSVYDNDLSDRGYINNNSPFIFYLKQALSGSADLNKDGLLTISEVQAYVRDKLEASTIKLIGNQLQTPLLFPLSQSIHERGEFLFLSPDCVLDLPSFDITENPYRGLLSYDISAANAFFGRSSAIAELKSTVDAHRLTVVSGASGTGKSSLVFAGIIPAYSGDHSIITFNPGSEAYVSLLKKFSEIEKGKRSLLYIDQLEEVFTQNKGDEQDKFFQLLFGTISDLSYDVKVIVSIRSDFESFLERTILKTFWDDQKNCFYTVPLLRTSEIREIIAKPAAQRLIEFNPPELIDTIAHEVENQPGALPLLSFFMKELYQELIKKSDLTEFTIEDYKNAGRVVGAIQRKANEFYKSAVSGKKKLLKKLVLRMISLESGDYTKQKLYATELNFQTEAETLEATDLLEQLCNAENRLIVREGKGEAYYQLAHDYLIKAWEDPIQWIQDMGTQKFLLYDQIRKRSYAYAKSGYKSREELMYEPEYAPGIAMFYPDTDNFLNADEMKFLEQSIRLRKRNQNVRNITFTSIIGLLVLIIAGLTIYLKTNSYKAETNRILALAQLQVLSDPTTALNLIEIVLQRDKNNAIAKKIEDGILSDPSICLYEKEMIHQFGGSGMTEDLANRIGSIDISADDKLLLSVKGRLIEIWSLSTYDSVTSILLDKELFVSNILFGKKPNTIEISDNAVRDTGPPFTKTKTISFTGVALDSSSTKKKDPNMSYFTTTVDGDKYEIRVDLNTIYVKNKTKEIKIDPDSKEDYEDQLNNALNSDDEFDTSLFDIRNPPIKDKILTKRSLTSEYIPDGGYNIDQVFLDHSGKYIIAMIHQSEIVVYDLSGNLVLHKTFYDKTLSALCGSPNSDLLFVSTNSADKEEGLVLDLQGNIIRHLESSDTYIEDALFSNDGKFIYTYTNSGTIRKWPLNKNIVTRFQYDGVATSPVSFFIGDTLTTISDNTAFLSTNYTNQIKDASNSKQHSSVSTQGTKPVTATAEFFSRKDINHFDLKRGLFFTDTVVFGSGDSVELSADYRYLLQSNKGNLDVYDLHKHLVLSIPGKASISNLSSLHISPAFHYYAMNSAPLDKRMNVFSSNGTKLMTADSTDAVAFSPDEKYLLSFGNLRYVDYRERGKQGLPALYQISGQKITMEKLTTARVSDAIFVSNQYFLLLTDSLLYRYHISGALKDVLPILQFGEHKEDDAVKLFSLQNDRFALSFKNNVFILSAEGEVQSQLQGHTGRINQVSMSRNGRWISTSGYDNVTNVWLTKEVFLKEKLPPLSSSNKRKFSL